MLQHHLLEQLVLFIGPGTFITPLILILLLKAKIFEVGLEGRIILTATQLVPVQLHRIERLVGVR